MRIRALIKRISLQMLRDKRTLALLFVAPLLILTLMYFLFNGSTVNPKLGVVDLNKDIIEALKSGDINVIEYETASNEVIIKDKLDGLLEMNNKTLKLTLENSDPSKAKLLKMKINQAIASQSRIANITLPVKFKTSTIDTNYIYGNSETTFFDVLSPILIGFFVFFFVFLISGIGLLRERTTGTLERLMATPIKRYEVVIGYLVGYGIFAVIQTLIVVLFSINILHIILAGSILNVILINLLLALVALSLGILLSTFASSEFQMIQFIPLVIIPQIFFAGIFPLEGMSNWLQTIGKIMPIYYGADALKSVMYKGYNLNQITNDLLFLAIFASIFIILNIVALKKYRRL
ncbi:ABC transporter permease [Clostridium botulinum]|uniref:ABC transporter, permease protein n=1 Tax=Clostridium botulinum (strain Langeland / NCTC 10281 / Type F) TaxID=441772 RepID=A7GB46_CLOBL|nr:ABC transporter permease [Clostridium botulinum]ABS41966.1 ABC transporter, permease protein [Clostridium botulinum F str. Langeland]ADF98469.1 ABC transporter, permease protein [Clostridium botulinum F str. 230613]KKM40242.1 ABC transporter permease [Clostridium botulinum]MBY6793471.1 ABC transporter permease [Clostridium botulinum]MBY6938963.1 ABC transporter permease [Clostridium botulinum]